jgi:hypothetical protein
LIFSSTGSYFGLPSNSAPRGSVWVHRSKVQLWKYYVFTVLL